MKMLVAARTGQRVLVFGLVIASLCLAPTRTLAAFDLDDVAKRAHELASKDFEDRSRSIPQWLLEVNYDQWRDIRFRPDQSHWRSAGLPFELQFFHCGLFYDRSVKMNEIDAEGVRPIAFSPNLFDYGKNEFGSRIPQDLGFAGFRVHYPINKAAYKDEVIVFVGASYLRAVAKDLHFGMSARGLAVDTAMPSGEEFPYFREFWLVRPTKTASDLIIYALLDSQRVTGAYKFVVSPGVTTKVSVESRIFSRRPIEKLGIAPLTSMFFCGEGASRCGDDYRPEIHDSDGLLLHMGSGEWLWRPVVNPQRLSINSFFTANPKGFGLLQRDRDFDHFQDIETNAERRPSAWVIPKGDWGAGHIELVQIPTVDDTNDNIVAYWVPSAQITPKNPMSFAYDLLWTTDDPRTKEKEQAGRVESTRVDSRVEAEHTKDTVRFTIDFESTELAKLPADTVLRGAVATMGGDEGYGIVEQQVLKIPATNGWRLVFRVPKARRPIELRAYLDQGGKPLTETWTYTLEP